MPIEIAPANQASCEELTTIFNARGNAANCQCQRYRLAPGEAFGNTPVEARIAALRAGPGGKPNCANSRAFIVFPRSFRGPASRLRQGDPPIELLPVARHA